MTRSALRAWCSTPETRSRALGQRTSAGCDAAMRDARFDAKSRDGGAYDHDHRTGHVLALPRPDRLGLRRVPPAARPVVAAASATGAPGRGGAAGLARARRARRARDARGEAREPARARLSTGS